MNPRKKKSEEHKISREKKSNRFLACFCHAPDAESPPEIIAGDHKAKGAKVKVVSSSKKRIVSPELSWSSSVGSSTSVRKRSRRLSGIKAAIFRGNKKQGSGGNRKVHQDPGPSIHSGDSESSVSPKRSDRRRKRLVGSPDSLGSESSSASDSESCSTSSSPENSISSLDCPSRTSGSDTSRKDRNPSSRRTNVRKSPIPAKLETSEASRKRTHPLIAELCYVIAVSLATTLIWGRIPAVLITVVWLYFAGRSNNSQNPAATTGRKRFPPTNHHGRVLGSRTPLRS